MATPLDGSELLRRYEAVEKAYCQGRWATVLEAGTALLRDLAEGREQPDLAGLHHRMQLLMAHTLLHGYGDRDAAEDLYELVRKSDAESSLRQMAEDGLDQCHQPLTSSFVVEEPSKEEDENAERPELFLPESEQVEPREPPKPRQRSLEEQEEAAPELEPEPLPLEPEAELTEEEPPADRGMAADPFHPANDPSPRRKAAKKRKPLEMPWLTPLPEEPEWDSEEEEDESNLPPVLRRRTARLYGDSPALIPDVVDEPELLEVHQASPFLAEEVELEVRATPSPKARGPVRELSAQEEQDLRACLLRVVVETPPVEVAPA
jgi:hypothetical protein